MFPPSLLAVTIYFLSISALVPPNTLGPRLQAIPVSGLDNGHLPTLFYTKPEWPNFGLHLAWLEPERLPTWLRPIPLSSERLVRSLVYDEYKTRPPKGRAPSYLTYGPENFVGKTNVSIDARYIVRQYVQQGRYRTPAAPMLNEEIAAVFEVMIWGGHTAKEIALTMCYTNGNLGHLRLTNCTGTIMLQRDLWTADA
ncbi:MAG: hypothetical protein LQ345_005242 [Seirophora villosa]|nr:MAG: hypothetical protein LQ345_005242 [Seirophora villosa]